MSDLLHTKQRSSTCHQGIVAENYLKLKQVIMKDATPTMESIRRIRQKFQEHGLYVGKNRSERLEEAESVREFFRQDSK